MLGGLVGAGLKATGLVEPKGSDRPVGSMGPFGGGMMGVGGLAGLATQGGFMGNAGGIGGLAGMALNQFGGPMAQGLPKDEQGPAQGPNTPVRRYGDQYMPYGPGGGGMPPTPMASMFGGPQLGQAGGLLGNANFFSDPMTIKRVS